MFLIELVSGSFLFNFMPEQGAVLLCSISLIGGAIAARKFFSYQDSEKKSLHLSTENEEK